MTASGIQSKQGQVSWSQANIAAANDPTVNAGIAIDNALMGFTMNSESPSLTENMGFEQAVGKQSSAGSEQVRQVRHLNVDVTPVVQELEDSVQDPGLRNADGMLTGEQQNQVSGKGCRCGNTQPVFDCSCTDYVCRRRWSG